MATLLLGGDPPSAYEATQVIAVETADRGGFGGGDPIGHVCHLYRNGRRMSIGRTNGVLICGLANQFGKCLPSADSDTHICEVQLGLGFFSVVRGTAAPRYS